MFTPTGLWLPACHTAFLGVEAHLRDDTFLFVLGHLPPFFPCESAHIAVMHLTPCEFI